MPVEKGKAGGHIVVPAAFSGPGLSRAPGCAGGDGAAGARRRGGRRGFLRPGQKRAGKQLFVAGKTPPAAAGRKRGGEPCFTGLRLVFVLKVM